MAEEISVQQGLTREQTYKELLPQIKGLITGEPDLTANMANIAAALKQTFNWWWVGFYNVKGDELVLGPFQGPIACTRIKKGKGVCGTSWERAATIIVPDVELFPGHIACSAASRSEIVVPVISNQQVIAVLDADSEFLHHFSETDQIYLEKICALLSSTL